MPNVYPYSACDVFNVNETGIMHGYNTAGNAFHVRPVVYLTADTKIISGDGTPDNMFVVGQ